MNYHYSGKPCVSAAGKANVFHCINNTKKQLVIVDGAAFGCEMNRVMQLVENTGNTELFLPESFEYLLLKSELMRQTTVREQLERTYDFADSAEYMSWEQFYTSLLVKITMGEPYQYAKDKLNPYYLSEKNRKLIGKELPEMIRQLS
jgi:hypothetical protein